VAIYDRLSRKQTLLPAERADDDRVLHRGTTADDGGLRPRRCNLFSWDV